MAVDLIRACVDVGLVGESDCAFADDVALDVPGAAADGEGGGEEVAVVPDRVDSWEVVAASPVLARRDRCLRREATFGSGTGEYSAAFPPAGPMTSAG